MEIRIFWCCSLIFSIDPLYIHIDSKFFCQFCIHFWGWRQESPKSSKTVLIFNTWIHIALWRVLFSSLFLLLSLLLLLLLILLLLLLLLSLLLLKYPKNNHVLHDEENKTLQKTICIHVLQICTIFKLFGDSCLHPQKWIQN